MAGGVVSRIRRTVGRRAFRGQVGSKESVRGAEMMVEEGGKIAAARKAKKKKAKKKKKK